ncbi:uncharacterized protein [Aristolochia californica]|uniref:uncharacterized protein n=1 Tax=Aristolochia californica TaxID=171875 RepID=UPI0035DFD0B8
MESDDDLIFSSPAEPAQSPIQQARFKRLKKASKVSETPNFRTPFSIKSFTVSGGEDLLEETPVSPTGSPSPVVETLNASDSAVNHSLPIAGTNLLEENSVSPFRSFSGSGNFEIQAEIHENAGFSEESKALSQQSKEKLGSSDECLQVTREESNAGSAVSGENADGLEMRPAKKRGSTDGVEGKGTKKKRIRSKDDDAKPGASDRTKRKLAKEKKCYLDMIHAESQRLLRETRDASFKPSPVVQKPISSVLEKIRQRKLEVLKKSYNSDSSDSFMNNDASLGDNVQFELQCAKRDCQQDGGNDDIDGGLPTINAEDGFSTTPENILSKTVLASKVDVEYQDPINIAFVEEHSIHSRSDSEDNQLEDGSSDHLEEDSKDDELEDASDKLCEGEYFSPSVLAEKLKEESTLSKNDLSEEEDNDKENIDPHPGGDPVKAFVDDEAEEEDDSDNEPMADQGSSEEDEEKESGEYEEFKDLIASGYQEKAIDTERRDELHQKWLQQQDAAETENILQRLNGGVQQKREESLLCDEEGYEQCDVGPLEEETLDLPPISGTRIKTRELKQMITKMFTDCEDSFLSDEEENETRLARQFYHNKSDDAASFLSPVEDESSREVFGLIKKLNIAPENKKRAKTSSFLETLVKGSNSSGSSKSSFLGRGHSNTLPSARKPGVSTVRSFIFGRDDSNSRSGIASSEDSSDLNHKEKQPARKFFAKHSTTQSKISTQEAKNETRTASGPSLFEILRASSLESSGSVYSEKRSSTSVVGQTQAEYHFTAFKSSRKTTKVEM